VERNGDQRFVPLLEPFSGWKEAMVKRWTLPAASGEPSTRVEKTSICCIRLFTILLLTVFGIFSFTEPSPAEGTFKMIVHPSSEVPSMTKDQASKFFLKKVTKWDNGHPVLPVDLGADSLVRASFSKEIHGKTVTAIKSYWQQKIFSGRDVPPPEKQSDAEVLAYVLANADAIGYVSENAPAGNTKVLKITD
jgi:hypothetical protein